MKKRSLLAVNLFLLLGLTACATAPLRDTKEIPAVSNRAQAGDKAALTTMLATLTPGKVQSPEIIAGTLRQMGPLMSQPQAKEAVKPHLTSPNRDIRAAAFSAWIKARPAHNAAAFDRELTTLLFANENRFGQLTDEEYRAAGYCDDPQALEFLRKNLGKYPEADPAIIRSLGEIIVRRKQTTPPTLSNDKGSDEEIAAQLAEETLTDYAGSEAGEELKKLAIRTIETSYGAAGYERLIAKLSDRYLPMQVRLNILNYLASTEAERLEQRLAATLPSIRIWFNSEPEYQKRMDEVFTQLTGIPPQLTQEKKRKRVRPTIPPPAKSILTQASRRQIARKDQRSRIVALFQKYHLDEEIVALMERHANSLVQEKRLKLDPATKIIFGALSKSKPEADFFELKKLAEQGFSVPGYYAAAMQAVIHSGRDYQWQLVAIRRLWGVKEDTAEILHRMYRAEKNLF